MTFAEYLQDVERENTLLRADLERAHAVAQDLRNRVPEGELDDWSRFADIITGILSRMEAAALDWRAAIAADPDLAEREYEPKALRPPTAVEAVRERIALLISAASYDE